MGLLGKVKNKVHQGLIGAKDAYVKLSDFIVDHSQRLPYVVAAMAPYVGGINPIGGIQMGVNAIALHKFYKDRDEKKKQDDDWKRIHEVQNFVDGIRIPLDKDDNNKNEI